MLVFGVLSVLLIPTPSFCLQPIANPPFPTSKASFPCGLSLSPKVDISVGRNSQRRISIRYFSSRNTQLSSQVSTFMGYFWRFYRAILRKISYNFSLFKKPHRESSQQISIKAIDENIPLPKSDICPAGYRWAIASRGTNLSGVWAPIVTPKFKRDYDNYLKDCGQNYFFRKVVMNAISLQREEIRQRDDGRELEIVATNPVGSWNRTLVASGADFGSDQFKPFNVTIPDPDGDNVNVEAWWDSNGTVHRSFLRGKPRVSGSEFETLRYLEGSDILICESKFYTRHQCNHTTHFLSSTPAAHVIWRFQRAA